MSADTTCGLWFYMTHFSKFGSLCDDPLKLAPRLLHQHSTNIRGTKCAIKLPLTGNCVLDVLCLNQGLCCGDLRPRMQHETALRNYTERTIMLEVLTGTILCHRSSSFKIQLNITCSFFTIKTKNKNIFWGTCHIKLQIRGWLVLFCLVFGKQATEK